MGIKCTKPLFEEKEVSRQYQKTGDECFRRKSFDSAVEYYQKALEVELALKSNDKPVLIKQYRSLAASYRELGDDEQAITYETKALRLASKNMKKYIVNVLNIHKSLSEINENRREVREAYKLGKKRWNLAKSYLGKRNIECMRAHFDYAVICYKHKGEEEAYKYFIGYIKNLKYFPDYERTKAADCHNYIGIILKGRGKLQLAYRYYKTALRLYQEASEIRNLDLAKVHYNLAILQKDRMEFEDSWAHVKQCISLQMNSPDKKIENIEETVLLMLYLAKLIPSAKKEILEMTNWFKSKLDKTEAYSTSLINLERIKHVLSKGSRIVDPEMMVPLEEEESKSEFEDSGFLLPQKGKGGRRSNVSSFPARRSHQTNAASMETASSFLVPADIKVSLVTNQHHAS